MSFSRQRAIGLWTFDSVVEDFEFEIFDENLSNAIDGKGGGSYSLQSPLIIGGVPGTYTQFDVGLTLSDLLYMTGGVESYGPVYIGGTGTFTVDKDSTFSDVVTLDAALVANDDCYLGSSSADAIIVNGQAIFLSTAAFNDVATFQSTSAFNDVATFNSLAYFNDVPTFYEGANFQKPLGFSGTARIPERQAIGGDANASYAAQTYTHVHCPASTLAASRNYTIDDTGALNGDRMRFSTRDSGFDINIKDPGGSVIAAINAAAIKWVDVERVLGAWYVMAPG